MGGGKRVPATPAKKTPREWRIRGWRVRNLVAGGTLFVFFAIGFETTAPGNAMAVWQARKQGIKNFSMLVSHVLVPPAIASILQSPLNRVQGFLGPGHVCTVMGYREYEPIAERFRVPIVISGFEPLDIVEGVLTTVSQLELG